MFCYRWLVPAAILAAACGESGPTSARPDAGTSGADATSGAAPDAAAGDADGDGVTAADGDCDDGDPHVYPGAPEICDGKPNDCDAPNADESGLVTHIGAGGDVTDLTEAFAAGSAAAPADVTIEDDGRLSICEGQYFAQVKVGALDLEVEGIEGREATSISGGDADAEGAVFVVLEDGARFAVHGLTIEDGTDVYGGGIYALGFDVEVELSDCALRGNRALGADEEQGFGGAVFADGRGVSVSSCVFEGNSSTGPGGAIASLATTQIEDSAFRHNEAFQGGAVVVLGRQLEVARTTFEENGAEAGGAVFVKDGDATLTDSTLRNNTRTAVLVGGGIVVTGGDLALTDTEVADHVTSSSGGGISVHGGDVTVQGGSISSNITVDFNDNGIPSLFAGYGGAAFVEDGTFSCSGTSLSGNQAVWGPGIWGQRDAGSLGVTASSCDFVDNSRISTNADTSTVHLEYGFDAIVRHDPGADASFTCTEAGCE